MTTTHLTGWFGHLNSRQESHSLIFCLPHSGAGTSAFRGWENALPRGIEIAAVRLPGREQRFREPPDLHPEEIATVIAARADRPYAIFGHSLGARLGFEVIRVLRRRGARLPTRLYVAAARPPDVEDTIARVVEYDDEQCVSALIELIGAPAVLRDDPELRELYLPILRSDLGWLHTAVYQPEAPLPVPLVALAGAADTQCGPAAMLGWARHTSACFRLHTMPGGHFFPQAKTTHLTSMMASDLLADVQQAARPRPVPPAAGEFHVCIADLGNLPGLTASVAELSPREAAHAARLRDAARPLFVGERVVLHRVVRRYLPGAAAPGIRFSLYRSGHLVLVGGAPDASAGVHVERARAVTGGGVEQLVIGLWNRGTSSAVPGQRLLRVETMTDEAP